MINNKLLNRLEILSKLKIDDNRRDEVIKNLSDIVDFVENLNELNLSSENSKFSSLEASTPLRKDKIKNNSVIINILKNSPAHSESFFVVPAIL